MLDKEQKLQIAKRITDSNTFKNAPNSIGLLNYLVEAHLEDRFLKEGIIDIEFFGSDPDEDKSNPKVRVNVYNLRKKLIKYYDKEGAADPWKIIIDKGQYAVRFEKPHRELEIKTPAVRFLPYGLLLVCMGYIFWARFPESVPIIWEDFFENKNPTRLYIGDAFGYVGKTVSGNSGWTRDYNVNSIEEYFALLEERPELKNITSPTDFTYSTRMAENATHHLSRFFCLYNHDFEIKYATASSFTNIKGGNTIYVGRMYNQENFTFLFNQSSPYIKFKDRHISIAGHHELPDTIINTESNTNSDYAIVSRLPGPNNTEQFFFFSNHDIGVMSTVEYFTNVDSLATFEKMLEGKRHFTAVYLATGQDRTDLKLERLFLAGQ